MTQQQKPPPKESRAFGQRGLFNWTDGMSICFNLTAGVEAREAQEASCPPDPEGTVTADDQGERSRA